VLHARVWQVEVGRTTLLLLDANVPENSESDRSLTARLYGGDARVRIRQELLLGVGGVRALQALGIHPAVLHLNEGHSAFATLEMTRSLVEASGLPFSEVVREVSGMTVFTTHTPVAAGHDRFPAPLVDRHLGTNWPKEQRLPETWKGIETVEDAELWETQQVLKARLINFVRNRLVAQARRRDEPDSAIDQAMQALDLNALTIGFARRFA